VRRSARRNLMAASGILIESSAMLRDNRTRIDFCAMGTGPIGRRFVAGAAALACVMGLGGCDPVVNIAGANFPSWLVCAIAGAVIAALIRPIFLWTRIEPYLWPLPIVYLSLGVLMGCVVYLIFFNRI
jgi:hypothetical protein